MLGDVYWTKGKVFGLICLALSAAAVLALAFLARYLILTSLIGLGLGVLISPLLTKMYERFRVPKALTAFLFGLTFLAGIGATGYVIYALLEGQVALLIERGPEIVQAVRLRAETLFAAHPWIEQQLGGMEAENYLRATAETLFSGVQNTVMVVAGLLLILALGLYVAIHSETYLQGFLRLFPAYLRERASKVLSRSANELRQWFIGQILVMGISGAATGIGLWIIGIEYWILLGFLTAVLGFIPFVGAIISGAAALIVTLGSQPDQVWWVFGLYVAIQQLEGDVTIPLVMKGRVKLPEAHLLVFVFVMGGLFGLLGVFIAPPVFALGRRILLDTYVSRMDEKVLPVRTEAGNGMKESA